MLALLAFTLLAQEEGERPEEVEQIRVKTAYTLDRDAFETDFVLSSIEFDDGPGERNVNSLTWELTYGVTDWLTAELEVPFLFLDFDPGDEETGVGDLALEFKGALRPEIVPVVDAAALGVRVSVPTGDEDRGLGEDEPEFEFFAALTEKLDGLSLFAHLFVEVQEEERTRYGMNFAVGAAPFDPDLVLYVGLNGAFDAGESLEWAAVPGIDYTWRDRKLQVGLGVPLGLTDEAEDWGVITDVQIAF